MDDALLYYLTDFNIFPSSDVCECNSFLICLHLALTSTCCMWCYTIKGMLVHVLGVNVHEALYIIGLGNLIQYWPKHLILETR